jgi:hypothetical protein
MEVVRKASQEDNLIAGRFSKNRYRKRRVQKYFRKSHRYSPLCLKSFYTVTTKTTNA